MQPTIEFISLIIGLAGALLTAGWGAHAFFHRRETNDLKSQIKDLTSQNRKLTNELSVALAECEKAKRETDNLNKQLQTLKTQKIKPHTPGGEHSWMAN